MSAIKYEGAIKPASRATIDPHARLAAGILRRAAEEAASGNEEAARWLIGDDAGLYLETLGIDRRKVIKWLSGRRKIPLRGNPEGGIGNKGIPHKKNGRSPVVYTTGEQLDFFGELEAHMTDQVDGTSPLEGAIVEVIRELDLSEDEQDIFMDTLHAELNAAIGRAHQAVTSRRQKTSQENLQAQYRAELAKIPRGDTWQITKLQQRYRAAGLKI